MEEKIKQKAENTQENDCSCTLAMIPNGEMSAVIILMRI